MILWLLEDSKRQSLHCNIYDNYAIIFSKLDN